MKLNDLKKEMAYKWKPQTCGEYGATMVAYIDARHVQDMLDDVCGAENWQNKYEVVNNNLFCQIGIKCDGEWVWKSDCGTESNMEKVKGEASDAFKRAAVQWGIGRFLYSLGVVKLKVRKHTNGKYYPCTEDGEIYWDKAQLNAVCNKVIKSNKPQVDPPKATEPPPTQPDKPSEQQRKVLDQAYFDFTTQHKDYLADHDGKVEFDKAAFYTAVWREFGKYPKVMSSVEKIVNKIKPVDAVRPTEEA
jgi:hypothetical protein